MKQIFEMFHTQYFVKICRLTCVIAKLVDIFFEGYIELNIAVFKAGHVGANYLLTHNTSEVQKCLKI